MEKLSKEKDVHVNFYEKDETSIVSVSTLRDDLHDMKVTIEADTETMLVKNAAIDLLRYPEEKCRLVKDFEKEIIGMSIGTGVGEEIINRFFGKCGCENLVTLLMLGLSGLVFVVYGHRIETGKITPADFGREIGRIRKDSCIAFNPEITI